MGTTIDLTGDSPVQESPRIDDAQHDEVQRQTIMAFARSRLNSVPSSGNKGFEAAKRPKLDHHNHSESGMERQNQIQTTNQNAEQPGVPTEPQIPPNPPSTMNDTLFMLRLEREARQRQRQKQEGQPSPGGAHAAAETQHVHVQGQGQKATEGTQHKRKRQEQPSSSTSTSSANPVTASILTYNIWFDPDAMEERMHGLGKEIEKAGCPDFVLLQEVTMHALQLFSKAAWVKRYTLMPLPQPLGAYFTLTLARTDTVRVSSRERVPFSCSCQGRDVTIVRAIVKGQPMTVGNTHLESPIPGAKFGAERAQQLQECLNLLRSSSQASGDVVLGGDMNLIDPTGEPDEQLREAAFVDAWPALRKGEAGLTYDARKNPMLTHSYPGRRLDRFFMRLSTCWQAEKVELVGTEPIPGKTVRREINRTTKATKEVPVLVSDHFGLLMHLRAQSPTGQKLGGRQEAPEVPKNTEVIIVDDD